MVLKPVASVRPATSAAGATSTDDAGRIDESGTEMSCRCETCSSVWRIETVNLHLLDKASIPCRFKACSREWVSTMHSIGFEPSQVVKVRPSRVIPPVVVELGELVGLMYRSDKGQPGQPRTYIHRMEDPPRLVSNIEGTQLYIVGGSYQVTPRGIEG